MYRRKRGRGTGGDADPSRNPKKTWIRKGPADPAKPTSPARDTERSPSPASPSPFLDPERSLTPAKPASPAAEGSSPSISAGVSPPAAEGSSPSISAGASPPAAEGSSPSISDRDCVEKVKVKEIEPVGDQVAIPHLHVSPSSEVLVPSFLVSEKGTAVLKRKEDDDFYTVTRKKDTEKVKPASGSPASFSPSQDSTSKKPKHITLTRGELDKLVETKKMEADEIKKEERRLKWYQEQQKKLHPHQRQQQQPNSIESRLKDFLGSFVKEGTEGIFYVKKVKFMRCLGSWELEVNFNDVMQQDFELAVDLVNCSSPEKLQSAAREFIKMHVTDNDKETGAWHSSIVFVSMPDSFIPVTELMKNPDALVDVYMNRSNLSILSAAIIGGVSEHILNTHSQLNRAWDGNFDLSDLYVINKSQFLIRKEPTFVLEGNQTHQFSAKQADLKRPTELLTPWLDCREPEEQSEPPSAEHLPIFYLQFCEELENVSPEDISEPWFRAYLLNSPALKMPLARHNLVCASHLALKRPLSDPLLILISDNACPNYQDWRKSISNSANDVLKDVYHYRGNDGENGSSQKQAGSEQEQVKPEPFSTSMKGIITYDRNLKNHGSKKVLFRSISEVEVFSAANLFPYLPKFVKELFKMEHILNEDFVDILSDYKYSRIRTIDGSEVKAVPQLSFWKFYQIIQKEKCPATLPEMTGGVHRAAIPRPKLLRGKGS